MHICVVSLKVIALFNEKSKVSYGGAEVQLYLLSNEISQNEDNHLNILTGYIDDNLKKPFKKKSISVFPSIPLRSSLKNYIYRPLTLFKKLIQINPDVIIQRSIGPETGIILIYCKLFNKKFIYSVAHDNEVLRSKLNILNRLLMSLVIMLTSAIVAQSHFQLNNLEKYLNKKNHISLIKSGYDIKLNKMKKSLILWVGRAVNWKRGEKFISLANHFPKESFLMICRHSDDVKYWTELKLRAKNVSNLRLLEFVPFKNIDYYFQRAKIFINTSISEGFPNTFIQALKNMVPIISLNVDPDNFLVDNEFGFNCYNNFDEMEQRLKELLESNDIYDYYSNNGYNFVLKNHNIEQISQKWIILIKNILNLGK